MYIKNYSFFSLFSSYSSKRICPIIIAVTISITPTLFHSKLKRYLFVKIEILPIIDPTLPSDCLHGL